MCTSLTKCLWFRKVGFIRWLRWLQSAWHLDFLEGCKLSFPIPLVLAYWPVSFMPLKLLGFGSSPSELGIQRQLYKNRVLCFASYNFSRTTKNIVYLKCLELTESKAGGNGGSLELIFSILHLKSEECRVYGLTTNSR